MEDIAIVAAFVLVYALVSRRQASTWITGPMVFVLFGLAVGPQGLTERRAANELVPLPACLAVEAGGRPMGETF